MSSLEAQEQSPKRPASEPDSIGGKLLADVHGWFEHQTDLPSCDFVKNDKIRQGCCFSQSRVIQCAH
jgi:hypothetical protein